MFKKSLILFPILLLLISTGYSQGRGGGQGQGPGQGQGQSQRPGQWQGQSQGQQGAQAGSMDREQKRVRATEEQRDQIRTCDKLADGIRKQAREMAQASTKRFSPQEANRYQNEIRNKFRAMEQQHERLMSGLDAGQQQVWREQIRNMSRLRQQVSSQLQVMEAELGSTSPDSGRVAERARGIEQTMNSWRKEYNTLSSQSSS